jgi:hypothetical protein
MIATHTHSGHDGGADIDRNEGYESTAPHELNLLGKKALRN